MPQMLHNDRANGLVQEKFFAYKRLSNKAD